MCSMHPRPRHRRPTASAIALAVVLIASLCLPSLTSAAQTAPTMGADSATILGVEAAASDVLIRIEWSDQIEPDEEVLLSLTDGDGEVVGSAWVQPQPGSVVEEVLAGSLIGATNRPQHHDSHLSYADGVAVAASYPLQVGLQCDSPETCEYELRGGISAPQMIVLSSQMTEALAEAEAAGVTDLLAWVAQTHPELYGDIFGMQWQMRSLGGTQDDTTGCSCFWTLQAEKETLDGEGTCGGSHEIEYRRSGELSPLLEEIVSGRSTLTPDVGCWQVAQTESNVIMIGGSEVPFEGTGIQSCAMECGGSAVFTGEYEVDLAAATNTSLDRASILDGVNFSLDGTTVFNGLFGLQSDGGTDRIDHVIKTGSLYSVPGAIADMVSGAIVKLEYEPTDPPAGNPGGTVSPQLCGTSSQVACAKGRSKGVHRIFVQAQSTCTGQLLYDAYSTFGASTSSKVGGDEIQIVVGKCDG